MEFSRFDARRYRSVSVREGYSEWARSYEDTVRGEMDVPLLASIRSVSWAEAACAVDLACGPGRTGAWMKAQKRCWEQYRDRPVSFALAWRKTG